ncbi:MAG: hypothetical protein AAF975_05695 [Spirochaetota bacterium]
MFLYFLGLFNLGLIIGLFFIFRSYIRREVAKVEYVRFVEAELQQLLQDVHRSAEEIIQVIEDRTEHLSKLLAENHRIEKSAVPQVREDSRLTDLRRDVNSLQREIQGLWQGLSEQEGLLEAELQGRLEELQATQTELQQELREVIGTVEEAMQGPEEQADAAMGKTERHILDAAQRAEIEQYIGLGLDARIISRKTGVPLHLVEILVGIKTG